MKIQFHDFVSLRKHGDVLHPVVRDDAYDWAAAGRPYYNVWPKIIPMLVRVELNMPTSALKLPQRLGSLLIRLPKQDNPMHPVTCILATEHLQYGVRWMQFDMFYAMGQLTAFDRNLLRCGDDLTIAEWDRKTKYTRGWLSVADQDRLAAPIRNRVLKLCTTLCLLGDDPGLIMPDVLSGHLADYKRSFDPELVKNAKAKGKFGWNIGQDIEVTPHYRRPHLALRWTGKGRNVPKIVPVKGALIHREKVSKLPTGYLGALAV